MTRRFNTAGACNPADHYMLPAMSRLPTVRTLVDQKSYFVLHAPRQVGKTTALLSLAQELTAEGRYAAVLVSVEVGDSFKADDDVGEAELAILGVWRNAANHWLPPELQPPAWPEAPPRQRISAALTAWAKASPRPLVVFVDEIDALQNNTLISILRQLRDGHPRRPQSFPWSLAIIGMRDVRDYKVLSGGSTRLGTASPFNIKEDSITLRNFTQKEVAALYQQHTDATGQRFDADAMERAFALTQGQPWLVNALAREVIEKMGVEPPTTITVEHIEQAKERLILTRAAHLDSLVARLHEARVHKILSPILAGTMGGLDATYEDDVSYVVDLGLVEDRPLRIANPIYREVIVRVLGSPIEGQVLADPRSFILPDGRLDFDRLLREFADFWREHGDVLQNGLIYHEVAPQLVLMAYLQRIVNSGGYVDREYGVGRGRIDLCVRFSYTGSDGKRAWQRQALELKAWAVKQPDPLDKGLAQLEAYLDRLGIDRGILVIFDRRPDAKPIWERTRFEDAKTPKGYAVTVLRG